LSADGVEMGVVLNVKGLHLVLAHCFKFIGHEVGDIEKRDTGGFGRVRRPLAVSDVGALDFAVLPDIADGQPQQDGRGAFGLGVRDHLAQIPAVGVNDFVFFGKQVVNLLRLGAETGN